MDDIIEAAARAIEAELAREEMVLADLLNLSMIMRDLRRDVAEKSARAAIAAIMPAIGERMAGEVANYVRKMKSADKQPMFSDLPMNLRALASTMAEEVGK